MHFRKTTSCTIWRINCNGGNDGDRGVRWEVILVIKERSLLVSRTKTVAEEIYKFIQFHEV